MLKNTLTIAMSAFLLISGTADLFAMELLDDLKSKPGKQLIIAMTGDAEPCPINHMPKDVTGLLLKEISKGTNPRRLTSVCKHWYSVMREDNVPQMAELHYSATNILVSAMNPFMQQCVHTYWDSLFYNGILRYKPIDNNGKVIEGRAAVTMKFSDFKDGTFNLSTCGNTGQYLVITTSMDRFFKVGEENKDKTVIAIMPRHRIQQEIKNTPDHSFASLITAWDADKAPVGMFWRWGNDTNLTLVDYLTNASISNISSRNLYENWAYGLRRAECAVREAGSCVREMILRRASISCQFLNQNKDY